MKSARTYLNGAESARTKGGGGARSAAGRALLALVASLCLWGVFFHEVAPRLGSSIPFTGHYPDRSSAARLDAVQGDHLQLLYHFWLSREKIFGRTGVFSNVYEFNLGDDAARREFDPGYLPFSLVYALVTEAGGTHALGWNLAQLAAVFVAYFFLLLLAARYSASEAGAHFAAALAMCVPYQWMNLSGGSPTGLGMAFVPAVALGLDMAVRDGRARGGALAGGALLFCWMSDLHCLLFAAMMAPAWCVVAWCARGDAFAPRWGALRRVFAALAPAGGAAVAVLGIAKYLSAMYAKTSVSGGRSFDEVMQLSPSKRALWGFILKGIDVNFQVGFAITVAVLLALGAAVAAGWALWRRGKRGAARGVAREGGAVDASAPGGARNAWLVMLLLFCGVILALLLGMGFNAPGDGFPMKAMRALCPPYKLIRQPVKALCVLPTLLAPLFALFAACCAEWSGRGRERGGNGRPASRHAVARRLAAFAPALLLAAGVAETSRTMMLGVCRLRGELPEYAAIKADAEADGKTPRILALPIWPGDSAWSSLYQYDAMLGGIRMLNGYSAVRTEDYARDVFKNYESVTQGRLTAAQADSLLRHGATALVVHQTLFPERVSPYPSGLAVERLLENPRLRLLAAGDVVAFKILGAEEAAADGAAQEGASAAAPRPPRIEAAEFVSPARRWSSALLDGATTIDAASASAKIRSPVVLATNTHWMVRTRGADAVRVTELLYDAATGTNEIASAAVPFEVVAEEGEGDARVRWLKVECGASAALSAPADAAAAGAALALTDWEQPRLEVRPAAGADASNAASADAATAAATLATLDILLTHGELPLGRREISLPATSFFHPDAGVLNLAADGMFDGVRFRPGLDIATDVFHGFHLPLDTGKWRVTLDIDTAADPRPAGKLRVRADGKELAEGEISTGAASLDFETEGLAPVTLIFRYHAATELLIKRVAFTRLDGADL